MAKEKEAFDVSITAVQDVPEDAKSRVALGLRPDGSIIVMRQRKTDASPDWFTRKGVQVDADVAGLWFKKGAIKPPS